MKRKVVAFGDFICLYFGIFISSWCFYPLFFMHKICCKKVCYWGSTCVLRNWGWNCATQLNCTVCTNISAAVIDSTHMTHSAGRFLWCNADLPWHWTSGLPQNSSLHSSHVLPPKPGLQEHWPDSWDKWIIQLVIQLTYDWFCQPVIHKCRCLCIYQVAGGTVRVFWVALARLTSFATVDVPCVGGTAVTVLTLHTRQTWALPAIPVTLTQAINTAVPGTSNKMAHTT